MGSQRVGHDWATDLNWIVCVFPSFSLSDPFPLSSGEWGLAHKTHESHVSFYYTTSTFTVSTENERRDRWCLLSCLYAFYSVQFTHSVMSDSLHPHGLQHARPLCPSPTPRAYLNSCPSSWWCHLTISSSIIPFSSCLQSFLLLRSFPARQFFTWSGQSIKYK